jgi:4-amino-4-deoxy-L-arabinose transferase-like glycosyltransferase
MLLPVITSNGSADQGVLPPASTPGESPSAAGRLWRHLPLLAVLLLALALRLWHLTQNGWGNEYYTAGVLSMTSNWRNFLYDSFDPAGFVSVDKPPVALWIQVASVKLFGFHGLSVLLPQVLEGLASVWIVYHLVQRRFGASAGLLAALFLAITPVSVAIDRSSNTDTCLVLVLLLAAWALTRAAEEGSRRFLLLSMALVGLGFNVKMLAAFVVLPTFVLIYFWGAPIAWRRRLGDLALAAVVLVTVSVSWAVIYDLTPPEHRPFAGTTKNNSMLELAIGPYAVGRFVPVVKRSETARGDPRKEQAADAGTAHANSAGTTTADKIRSDLSRLFVRAPAGPLRLADGQMAGQVGWLVPLAVMGLALGAYRGRFRRPPSPAHLSLMLWFGWAVTYGVVYSYAGGIMHLYYLATMAPPLAALAAIGVVSLWDRYLQRGWGVVLLPSALLLTAVWQLYVQGSALGWTFGETASPMAAITALRAGHGDWQTWLHVAFLTGTLAAVGGLLIIILRRAWGKLSPALAAAALGMGLLALLVLPLAWALSSVLVPGHGVLPSADLARLVHVDGTASAAVRRASAESMATSKLVGFLKANRQGERYLLSTSTTRLAAPIIIGTGEAVMARGGFHGLDPILSTEKLARMVTTNQVRFAMLGDLWAIDRMLGAEAAGRPIAEWVEAHGKLVDPTLWRSAGRERGRVRLYDLRPDVPLMPAPYH